MHQSLRTSYAAPSKDDYRDSMGEQFTEELFEQYQRYFHRKQLRPFATVLFGNYLTYFRALEAESESPISG